MPTKPRLIHNPFLSSTENNYEKMLLLTQYHYDALVARKGDVFFDELLTFYFPFQTDFVKVYKRWKAAGDDQQGDTQSVKQRLADLIKLIVDWDIILSGIYHPGTGPYKSLLPNGHQPFQKGKQENRIMAVGTLLVKMGSDAALAALKATIQTWYDATVLTQATKKGKITITGTSSLEVEISRVATAEAMWKNFGDCISHYYKTPDMLIPLFNWEEVYPGEQMEFLVTITEQTTKVVVRRTLDVVKQRLRVTNSGTVAAEVGCAAKANGAVAQKSTIAAGDTVTLTADQIGNTKATPFIIAMNSSAISPTHLSVEIVKA